MGTAVSVQHLQKRYGSTVAVADVSFDGEIFGLLGPNGSGRTTTVECLQGLRHADDGTLEVLGLDARADPAAVRRAVGSQLQDSALPDRLRVGEALRLCSTIRAGSRPWVSRGLEPVDLRGEVRTLEDAYLPHGRGSRGPARAAGSGHVRALAAVTATELRLFARDPMTVLFVLVLPVVILYVLNGVFGGQPADPSVWEGVGAVDFYTSAYVALVAATVRTDDSLEEAATERPAGTGNRPAALPPGAYRGGPLRGR
ncbi:ATP-binding cassette domain-containing protein [Actinotalea sp. Marseille-Q4924]|uniref:ATP-binding cassette domain-containing protein n=1 Tax=Actinotalea sp. Marseille-Q4924 TaxID=2866571 RepID=UPI001CE4A2F8|nr:ATP-binding cassette domain-containing protein [Actinotalea sp. Marseille-Q4924]